MFQYAYPPRTNLLLFFRAPPYVLSILPALRRPAAALSDFGKVGNVADLKGERKGVKNFHNLQAGCTDPRWHKHRGFRNMDAMSPEGDIADWEALAQGRDAWTSSASEGVDRERLKAELDRAHEQRGYICANVVASQDLHPLARTVSKDVYTYPPWPPSADATCHVIAHRRYSNE